MLVSNGHSFSSLPTLVGALLFLCILSRWLFINRNYRRKLPPGPSPNLYGVFQVPAGVKAWLYWQNSPYAKNGIITIHQGAFAPPNFLITSPDIALDILEKRNATSADRPTNAVANVLTGQMGLLFARYGPQFRRYRKFVHHALMPQAAESYGPMSERAARNVLRDMLQYQKGNKSVVVEFEQFRRTFHAYAASVIQTAVFAKRQRTTMDDKNLRMALQWNLSLVGALTPGVWKCAYFPWLRFLPGYFAQPKQAHERQLQDYRLSMKKTREDVNEGCVEPSVIRWATERQKEYNISDDELAWLSGSLFHAGSDSTAVTINHALLTAVTYADAQRTAQEEIDHVVGRQRTPSFEDMPNLPYTQAFVKEVIRFRGATPGGFPHRMMQDEKLPNGWVIPKDSLVFAQSWSLHRSTELYGKDVETFRPSRWLDSDGQLRTDMRHFAFGHGRRICPGMYLAERSIFINLTHLLWAFEILPTKEESPEVRMDPATRYTSVGISSPLPYDVKLVPRRGNLEKLLGEEELMF
ncbi:cytochrome P450 [Atractiella rhizophila]|nr:cytochrome P450 [Atractiella rhizophila]